MNGQPSSPASGSPVRFGPPDGSRSPVRFGPRVRPTPASEPLRQLAPEPHRPPRFDSAELKRHPTACDPVAMATRLGIEGKPLGDGFMALCAWHPDRKPSMSMRRGPDGTLAVRCFTCNAAGNIFHLTAQRHGLDHRRDFGQVLGKLAELIGASPGQGPTGSDEWERAKRRRAADREAAVEAAAVEAHGLYSDANPVKRHAYLEAKVIQAHGARVDHRGHLVIPFQDPTGKVWTVQTIAPDGSKRFFRGGRMAGNFVCVRNTKKSPGPKVVCEGWATACSIAEATGFEVWAAGSAMNLANVARVARVFFGPTRAILVAADDDPKSDGSNPGRTAAEAAALEVGGTVALPDFGPDRPEGVSDWNDLHQLAGLDAVRAQFAKALA